MREKTKKTVRTFSPVFKKVKVKLYEEGQVTVLELSRLYGVSRGAIYKWIKKYSKLPETERYVVEKKSEASKNIELLKKIGEMEKIIGQLQMGIMYRDEVIKVGSELLGDDLKKKVDTKC